MVIVRPKGMGGGDRKLVFIAYKVLIWKNEQVLEMGGDDGCTTRWMYLLPLNVSHVL